MSEKIVKGSFHSQKKSTSPKHNDHDYMKEKKDVEIVTYVYTQDIYNASNSDNTCTHDYVMKVLEGMYLEDERKKLLVNKCDADELLFYKNAFGVVLEQQNERHRKSRHKERIKDMDQWRKLPNYCPSEDVLQIGNKDCFIDDRDLLKQCVSELMEWEEKKLGKNYMPITLAYHYDESSPHCHKRGVYVAWDDNGNPFPCTKDALKQAGIPLPDPTKKESKTNNRKKTYDSMKREAWLDIIEKYLPKGYILDRTVDKNREMGHMEVDVYKAYCDSKAELEQYKADLNQYHKDLDQYRNKLQDEANELYALKRRLKAKEDDLNEKTMNYTTEVKKRLKTQITASQNMLEEATLLLDKSKQYYLQDQQRAEEKLHAEEIRRRHNEAQRLLESLNNTANNNNYEFF